MYQKIKQKLLVYNTSGITLHSKFRIPKNCFKGNEQILLLQIIQVEALSNYDNFTLITILHNNDVLIWDYNKYITINKYQVTIDIK